MVSSAAVQSPADLANVALVRMGYKLSVGSLYDGSSAAKKILDIYAQTRDELLRSFDWGFAERNIALTLLKQAPIGGYVPPATWNPATNPPVGYLFEYAYPGDCLKVRSVKPTPLFFPNFDPQPYLFDVANDSNYNPAQRVILCNVPSALITYTGQVTDPATWDVGFSEQFAASLGRHLGPALVSMQAAQALAGDEQAATMVAEREQG